MDKSICFVLVVVSSLFCVLKSEDHCGPDTVFGPQQDDQILSETSPNFKLLLSATEDSRASCVDRCCKTDMCNIMSYNESALLGDAVNCFIYTCLPLDECYFTDSTDVVTLTLLPKEDSDDTTSLMDNEKIQKEVDTHDGPQKDQEIFSENIVDVINNTTIDLDTTNQPSTTNSLKIPKTLSSLQTTNKLNPTSSTLSNQITSVSDESTINLAAKTTSNTVPSSVSVANTSTLEPSTKTSFGSNTNTNSPKNQTTTKVISSDVVKNNENSTTFLKSVTTKMTTQSTTTTTVSQNPSNDDDFKTIQEQTNATEQTSTFPSKVNIDKTTSVINNQTNSPTVSQLKPPTLQITNSTTVNKPSSAVNKSTTTTTSTTTSTTTTMEMPIANATEMSVQHEMTTHEQQSTTKEQETTTQKQETTTAKQQSSTEKQQISTGSPKESKATVLGTTNNITSTLNKANQHSSSTATEDIYENMPPVLDKNETILPETLFTSDIGEDVIVVTPNQASAKLVIPNEQNNTMSLTVAKSTIQNKSEILIMSEGSQVEAQDVTVLNNTLYLGGLNITFADSTLKEEAEESHVLSTALIAALSFGILFFFAVLVLLGRRCFDSWQRRHYSRVDYLVNGMYN